MWNEAGNTGAVLLFAIRLVGISSQTVQENTEVEQPNFATKLGSWAESARSLWSFVESFAEEECADTYMCDHDTSPAINKLHKPVSNGCGSLGYNVDKYVTAGMTQCCHRHDECFSTCRSKKSDCDALFKKCLYDVCRNDSEWSDRVKLCQLSAKALYGATLLAGCSSFRSAQVAACLCDKPPRHSAPPPKRRKEL